MCHYDIKWSTTDDKFVSAIMHASYKSKQPDFDNVNTPIFQQWRDQSGFQFGFIPLQEQLMPNCQDMCDGSHLSLLQIHSVAKSTGKPNFLKARVPVHSQLHIEAWEQELAGYWDQQ